MSVRTLFSFSPIYGRLCVVVAVQNQNVINAMPCITFISRMCWLCDTRDSRTRLVSIYYKFLNAIFQFIISKHTLAHTLLSHFWAAAITVMVVVVLFSHSTLQTACWCCTSSSFMSLACLHSFYCLCLYRSMLSNVYNVGIGFFFFHRAIYCVSIIGI